MNFYDYWLNLSDYEKSNFASEVGLSEIYIGSHVLHRRRVPQLKTLKKMAKASNGILSYHGLCDFFVEKESA